MGQHTAVCILGMHRAGSSAVARIVNLLGAFIGEPQNLMPTAPDNPAGFWEHAAIYGLHQRLFRTLNTTWDSVQPLPDEWWQAPGAGVFRRELRRLVETEFSAHPLWMWKDPRTSVLLPLWRDVLNDLGIGIRHVICLRNPVDTAKSLQRRNAFTRDKAYALWYVHMLSALHQTSGTPRVVVDFDALLADPHSQIGRIVDILGVDVDLDGPDLSTAIAGFLDPRLRHSHTRPDEALKTVPEPISSLYSTLLQTLADSNLLESATFNSKISAAHNAYADLGRLIHSAENPLAEPGNEALDLSERSKTASPRPASPTIPLEQGHPPPPHTDRPVASIVLVPDAEADFESITAWAGDVPYEVILIADGWSDVAAREGASIANLTVIHNRTRRGLAAAASQGAQHARGDYLIFPEHDVRPEPGWLSALVRTVEADPGIGAAGARVEHGDGTLDEAGCILWDDASVSRYGHGDDAHSPPFQHLREVDFCSLGCLLVRTQLFLELGGLDPGISDPLLAAADLCLVLREHGFRTVFQPQARLVRSAAGKTQESEQSRLRFARMWQHRLGDRFPRNRGNLFHARDIGPGLRVLVFDDSTPDDQSGSNREINVAQILEKLISAGHNITLVGTSPGVGNRWTNWQAQGVEILKGGAATDRLIDERRDSYDAVVVTPSAGIDDRLRTLRDAFANAAFLAVLPVGHRDQARSGALLPPRAFVAVMDRLVVPTPADRDAISELCDPDRILVWSDPAEFDSPDTCQNRAGLSLLRYLKQTSAGQPNRRVRHMLDQRRISELQALAKTVELETYALSLRDALENKEKEVAELQSSVESTLEEKDRHIGNLEAAIAEKDLYIASLSGDDEV